MSFKALRCWLSGAAGGVIVLGILVSASVPVWPDLPIVKTAARILENPMPQLLTVCLAGLLALPLLRAPRIVSLAAALAWAAATGLFLQGHLSRAATLQPQAPADLTVLWFNMLYNNPLPARDLARALGESGADIVLLGEPVPLAADLPALDGWFPLRVGCEPETRCEFIALARDPAARIETVRLGRTQERRLAIVRVPGPDGRLLTVVGLHLFKPWFYGIAESEEWLTLDALARLDGPLVMMGDLNAAPWSRRGRLFTDLCALAPPRIPRPTWPADAGWLGLPIDNLLVRDVAIVSVEPWGEGLGSNHLGLLARLSHAGSDWEAARPPSCRPPWTPGQETPLTRARRLGTEGATSNP